MAEYNGLLELFGGGDIASFAEIVLAIGGLGLAASALLDATKAWGWGIARVGFPTVKAELDRYQAALTMVLGPEWDRLLAAHWINGRSKADQKSLAVALVMLGLSPKTVGELELPALVDGGALAEAVVAVQRGEDMLSDAQIAVLGRFRTIIDTRIDAAFERADQRYRNVARVYAGLIAIVLSVMVTLVMGCKDPLRDLGAALLIGAFAVPLAPIAKDLAGAITAAARAVKFPR